MTRKLLMKFRPSWFCRSYMKFELIIRLCNLVFVSMTVIQPCNDSTNPMNKPGDFRTPFSFLLARTISRLQIFTRTSFRKGPLTFSQFGEEQRNLHAFLLFSFIYSVFEAMFKLPIIFKQVVFKSLQHNTNYSLVIDNWQSKSCTYPKGWICIQKEPSYILLNSLRESDAYLGCGDPLIGFWPYFLHENSSAGMSAIFELTAGTLTVFFTLVLLQKPTATKFNKSETRHNFKQFKA